MNYIELINHFWKTDLEYSFTGNETKLYMFILHTSNSLGWKNPVRLSYRQVELGSGLTANTLKRARNKLKQAGLIDFTPGRKGNANDIANKTTYEIRWSRNNRQPDHQPDSLPDNPPTDPTANINKQENKIRQDIPPLCPPGEDCRETVVGNPPTTAHYSPRKEKSCGKKESILPELPYHSEAFRQAWEHLLQCPKWKRKSTTALQMALTQLARFDEEYAILLIEATTANNWQGVVFSDTPERYRKWQAARHGITATYSLSPGTGHNNSRSYENF